MMNLLAARLKACNNFFEMTNAEINITASTPAPTTTGVRGGVDVSVTITMESRSMDGNVTLLRDHTGCWVSWGEPANWVDGNLLEEVGEWATDDRPQSEILQLICSETAKAIEDDPNIDEAVNAVRQDRIERWDSTDEDCEG